MAERKVFCLVWICQTPFLLWQKGSNNHHIVSEKNNSHTKEHKLWNPIPQKYICMHLTQFLHGKPIKKIPDIENLLIILCIPYSWTFHQKHLWLNKSCSQGQISKWTHIDQLNRNFLWLNIECVLDYIHQLIRDYLGSISGLYCKFQNGHILISWLNFLWLNRKKTTVLVSRKNVGVHTIFRTNEMWIPSQVKIFLIHVAPSLSQSKTIPPLFSGKIEYT